MKLFKSLLLCIFFLTACGLGKPRLVWFYDDDEISMLNGNVKQVLTVDALQKEGFYRGDFDENLIYTLSQSLEVWEDNDGKHSEVFTSKATYYPVFDRKGRKTSIICHWLGTESGTSKWEFDNNGRAINLISNIVDPPYCSSYYKYNSSGDMIEHERVYCTKIVPDLFKNKYDRNHLLIESDMYEEHQTLVKTTFQYLAFDSNRNWTKRISHKKYYRPMREANITDTVSRKITYY